MKKSDFRETVIRSRFRLTYQEARRCSRAGPAGRAKTVYGSSDFAALVQGATAERAERGSLDLRSARRSSSSTTRGFRSTSRNAATRQHAVIRGVHALGQRDSGPACVPAGVRSSTGSTTARAPEKTTRSAIYVAALGYISRGHGREGRSARVAEIIEEARGKPEEELVNTVILRSMKQARYQGRTSATSDSRRFYTHFTSPRRYPDLEVHRT